MKKSRLNYKGKKYKEWIKARKGLIERAVKEGVISMDNGYPEGNCKDCYRWRPLTPDHIEKRSQGGNHSYENIDWICWECHDKRDNLGDPMGTKKKAQEKKGKKKSTKADFMKSRKCKHCGAHNPGMAMCPNCKEWDL